MDSVTGKERRGGQGVGSLGDETTSHKSHQTHGGTMKNHVDKMEPKQAQKNRVGECGRLNLLQFMYSLRTTSVFSESASFSFFFFNFLSSFFLE